MEKRIPITTRGAQQLRAELDELKKVRRPEVVRAIAEARDKGDLSENAEYDAARKAQAEMEGEIAEIEAQLRLAKIIHETTVTCCEVKDGVDQEVKTYTIVGTTEADLANGRISDESPVGAALIKSNDGETVPVALPNGRTKYIKVIKVTR